MAHRERFGKVLSVYILFLYYYVKQQGRIKLILFTDRT
nr:MAG TPA: hypothetical protein [Caudoviricetes sp.]